VPDEEIWEGIPKEFFEEECDAALFTLQVRPGRVPRPRRRHCLLTAGARALPGGGRRCAKNLPDELTIATLEREQAHQTRALDMVDSKLSGVIMDNYKAFGTLPAGCGHARVLRGAALTQLACCPWCGVPPVQGMSRVEEFSTDLKTTTFLLRTSRQHLEQARKGLTGGGMEIVAKARKLRVLQVRRLSPVDGAPAGPLMCASPLPRRGRRAATADV